MSNAVIPRQQGDEFQAKYFWYKACKLFLQDTTAIRVAWEISEIPGFDDVSIYFEPGVLDKLTGKAISSKFYQVKFHVDHSEFFTCEALTKPEFIGNQTESILQRLHKNYKDKAETFANSLYYIVNTWSLDPTDTLKELINNEHAIILPRLFDGTTDKSKMGKIKKMWREHLGITSDDELKEVLSRLRIVHNAKASELFTEDLNIRLQLAGLQPISEVKRTSPYTGLIQQLHLEKRNTFTKVELLEILERESLLFKKEAVANDYHKIGVRSFKKGTESISNEADEYLCLLRHFTNRFVIDDALWQTEILPSLSEFAEKVVEKNKPLLIHLDTHQSVAFALGSFLDSKAGVQTNVAQKVLNGRIIFSVDQTSADFKAHQNDVNWDYEEIKISDEGNDIVVALSVTRDIKNEVQDYVMNNLSDVSRIISATIVGGHSPTSIRDGNHIYLAVQELITKLRQEKSGKEKQGTIHIFVAAPNALVFSLGQNFKSLGKIKLYEYDFEQYRTGTYTLSMQLPF
jgi:hypothetical protein